MNRYIHLLAALVIATGLCLLTAGTAYAWGANGHRIVAKIGEDRLSPKAHAAVRALAGNESLALLSTWPDFIRSEPNWDCAKPWHYLTVEDGQPFEEGMAKAGYTSKPCKRDLFVSLGMPDNIVEAIDYFAAIVGGDQEKTSAFTQLITEHGVAPYRGSVRLTALAFLVHFVGDLHQPLHVGRGDDRGGNSITTQWFGDLTRLHALWDTELIEHEQLSYTEFAEFLEQTFIDKEPVQYGTGPATWAQESVSYREQVYDIGDKRDPAANLANLSWEYAAKQNALLKLRLYQGGRRLAQLLNKIFADGQ